jgi:hypothetical protein
MNQYKITTHHNVYVDSYEQGEGEYANGYTLGKTIVAENPRDAIQKYFEEHLYYKFEFINAYIHHEEEEDETEYKNTLNYSVLVDEESEEATNEQIELWKERKKVLYSNNISLFIEQLIPVTI